MKGIQLTKYAKVRDASNLLVTSTNITSITIAFALTLFSLSDFPQKGPDELVVQSLPDVQPLPDQYLIAVHAAAANFFDILQIQGKYQNQPRKLVLS